MSDTLDQWEAYSHLTHYRDQMEQDKPELNRRIRKLIDLVRKKDKLIQSAYNELNPHPDDVLNVPKLKWVNNNLSHALSLTEQLK